MEVGKQYISNVTSATVEVVYIHGNHIIVEIVEKGRGSRGINEVFVLPMGTLNKHYKLKPIMKTGWVNLYLMKTNEEGVLPVKAGIYIHDTEKLAVDSAGLNVVDTVKITYQVNK